MNNEIHSYNNSRSTKEKHFFFNMHLLLLIVSLSIISTIQAQIGQNPKNIQEAIEQLSIMHHDTTKQQILSMTEDEFTTNEHFGLGLWIRNKWGLWQGSKLNDYFNSIGISHPDDMSTMILTSYYRKLRYKDWDLDKYIRYYEDSWKEQTKYKYKMPDTIPFIEHEK